MTTEPKPYVPPTHPVSVKGVVVRPDGAVLLLRNEREEWELPGGRLEVGEEPEVCVVREITEETGLVGMSAGPLLDVWVYQPIPGRHVLIVTYGCITPPDLGEAVVSEEHKEIGWFYRDEVPGLVMPDGYKRSIASWYADPRRAK